MPSMYAFPCSQKPEQSHVQPVSHRKLPALHAHAQSHKPRRLSAKSNIYRILPSQKTNQKPNQTTNQLQNPPRPDQKTNQKTTQKTNQSPTEQRARTSSEPHQTARIIPNPSAGVTENQRTERTHTGMPTDVKSGSHRVRASLSDPPDNPKEPIPTDRRTSDRNPEDGDGGNQQRTTTL
ncbi:hypothetical protein VF21_00791 [Pseudogymnoascus sp. 05NY08]|nr:hypothetical protein VF21_00791 [Pseudogymnoascus sp. 05NY08]